MRTLVVRSRRSPPAAANEAMAIASAMPAASTPLLRDAGQRDRDRTPLRAASRTDQG